jgi:mannose-6-phosphate isomerase-like protein (cupin superfamily)
MTVTPIDLFSCFLHLHPGGEIQAEPRAFDPERGGWRLTAFHAKTDADVHADHWEVHPEAEEVVSCLIGKIRLYLRPDEPGQREEEIRLTAGTAAIVPRGRWHRMELDTPSTILAVTLPHGSRLEKRPVNRPRGPVPGRAGPGR